MNGLDLFKKIGVGARFDLKRFGTDAKKLQVFTGQKAKESDQSQARKSNDVEQSSTHNRIKNTKQDSCQSFVTSQEEEPEDDDSCQSFGDDNEGAELQLLGPIRSKGDFTAENRKRKKKQKGRVRKQDQVKQEQINHLRHQHKIHVHGTDVPDPLRTFDELNQVYNVSEKILENIQTAGYLDPTAIQRQAVPVMLHRRELLACAPTGSGKTAAFLLPIMQQLQVPRDGGVRALILAPTRELAQQTYRECVRLSDGLHLRVHCIEKADFTADKVAAQTARKLDIMVTTPNRLVHLLEHSPPLIALTSVEWLIIDESDKLFETGKTGFREQLAVIYKACDSKNVRRAMFSATFTHDVELWCRLNLDNVVQVYIGARNSATSEIQQQLVYVGTEGGKLLAIQDIIRKGLQPPVLVFVQSKDRAKELYHELVYDRINVEVIHADRNVAQRDSIIRSFRSGAIWVLICTELLGRGIDFKGVNLVINYDFPNSAISYIHRIGRTGRAGRSGKAVTFFTEQDKVNLRSIANVLREAGCSVPEYMLHLKHLNKGDRRRMAKSAPKRASIRTIPRQDIEQARSNRKKFLKKKVVRKSKVPSNSGKQNDAKTETRQKHKMVSNKDKVSKNIKLSQKLKEKKLKKKLDVNRKRKDKKCSMVEG